MSNLSEEQITEYAYEELTCNGSKHHKITVTKMYLRHWGLKCSYCEGTLVHEGVSKTDRNRKEIKHRNRKKIK